MGRNAADDLNTIMNVAMPQPLRTAGRAARGIGPSTIRAKMSIAFLGLLSVVVAFFLLYFPPRLERHVLDGIGASIDRVTWMTVESLKSELSRGDPARLNEALNESHNFAGELRYLVLEEASGDVLAAVNLEEAQRSGYRMAVGAARPGRLRSLFRTVSSLGSETGTGHRLYLGFAFPDIIGENRRESAVAFGVAAAVLALGMLLVFVFSGSMTRPLVLITRTAERVSRGDLKQRARIFSRDEVGSLARSFNAMLDGLEKEHVNHDSRTRSLEDKVAGRSIELEREIKERLRMEKELRLVKQELEARVSKRTEELSNINEELHGRIAETHRSRSQLEHTLEQLAKSLEGTIDAMSLTIEMRDMYTAGHQRRVASLAVAIAEEMQLTVDKVEGIRMSGIIHDIGKIAMPAEILTKPARLSKTEFQLIKEHPRVGYDILKKIEFPWPVAQIILQHHERMDGSGYPDGLLGEAILLEARILAVADVVEAQSSHRPYRPALGLQKALDDIRRGRGIRYDLQVVDACLNLFKEHRFAFKKEADLFE